MLNEIDNILQEIDKFKGSVQSSEEFARQLHKDLEVIEAYTDTVKNYEQQLLSALEKNTQSGQKHVDAVGQTILLELGKCARSAEDSKRDLLSELEKNKQTEKQVLEDKTSGILLQLASNRQAEQKEREAATRSLLSVIEKTAKEMQKENEALTIRIESLIKRKMQWLLLISALNSVGILLMLFLR